MTPAGASTTFTDRADAGRRLADHLVDRDVAPDVVLAIPRGGLPVGRPVADALGVPLDVIVAAKIGAPGNPELAIGAVGSDGEAWIDESTVRRLGVPEGYVARRREEVAGAAAAKEARYRDQSAPRSLDGTAVLLVDDGAATGSTAMAAIRLATARDAERVLVALPVAPRDTLERLRREADDVVCLVEPPLFGAVGQFYDDFRQVSDDDAIALLDRD